MIFKSTSADWFVGQYNDFRYFYIEKNAYDVKSLDYIASKAANSLVPIGPTNLVEWNE